MKILINDNPVDFKLGEERSLLDVLKNIEKWGMDRDLILASFKVNESKPQYLVEENFEDQPLSEVNKIELEMQSTKQVRYESALSLKTFLDQFQLRLNKAETKEIAHALNWIEKSANSFLDFFNFSNKSLIVDAIKEIKIRLHRREEKEEVSDFVSEKINTLKNFAGRLVFKTWIYLLADFVANGSEKQLKSLKTEMQNLMTDLVNQVSFIAEKIQTGRDEEAMSSLEDFSEAYQLLNHYLEKMHFVDAFVNGVRGADILNELKKILFEIENCLREERMTELSDLIEYELGEKLKVVGKFMRVN